MSKTNFSKVSIEVLKRELSVSTNEIIKNILDDLFVEYDSTGTISEETASHLIGKRPKFIDSKDTQYLDCWAIHTKDYETKFKFLKEYVAALVSTARKERDLQFEKGKN